MVDAIDEELRHATTEMELRKSGSGLPCLPSELDRRVRWHAPDLTTIETKPRVLPARFCMRVVRTAGVRQCDGIFEA